MPRSLPAARAGLPDTPSPLPSSFYGPSASDVAPKLLGHFLLRRTPNGTWVGGPIVETEAYLANDPACHGYRRETPRNRSMYGPPGRAYVYFIYGNYFCCNAVCAPPGVAEAVLIRALEPAFGESWMRENRPVHAARDLTSGPGKLCRALQIERDLDGEDLAGPSSNLIIASNPRAGQFLRTRGKIITATRIGLSVAADLPLRFYLEGSRYVSKRSQSLR